MKISYTTPWVIALPATLKLEPILCTAQTRLPTPINTSGLNNGSDTCFPYIGYTTDPDHFIDDGINADPNDPNNASDIGYHYPMDIDEDGDGLYLCQESRAGTSDNDMDSDGDGLVDGWGGFVAIGNWPRGLDIDGDGFVDGENDYYTDPNDSDSDGDGIPDGWELLHGYNPNNPADASANSDGDGLTNLQEYQLDLNPEVYNKEDSWVCREYDQAGAVTRQYKADIVGTSANYLSESQNIYDEYGRVTLIRQLADPGGSIDNTNDAIILKGYNLEGNLDYQARKAPGQNSTELSLENDLITQYYYDGIGRQTQIVDCNDWVTSYYYDVAGQVTQIVDPAGKETHTYYDAAGRITRTDDPDGNYRLVSYDSRGKVLTEFMMDSLDVTQGQSRKYYDIQGNVTRQVSMADPTSTSTPNLLIDRVVDYSRDYDSSYRLQETYTYSGNAVITSSSYSDPDYDGSGTGRANVDAVGKSAYQRFFS